MKRDPRTIDSLLDTVYAMPPSSIVDEVLDEDAPGMHSELPAFDADPLQTVTLYEDISSALIRLGLHEDGNVGSRTRTALYPAQQARIAAREAFRDKILSLFHRCIDPRFAQATSRPDLDVDYAAVRGRIETDHAWILERAGETVERYPRTTRLRVRVPGMTHWYTPHALLQLIAKMDPRDPDDVRDLERAARAAQ